MAITCKLRDFYDNATEIVGIKSGILLNYSQTNKFLTGFADEKVLSHDLNNFIRIHSSEFEEYVIYLRQKIGNLPNEIRNKEANTFILNYFKNDNVDFSKLELIQRAIFELIKLHPDLSPSELSETISSLYNCEIELGLSLAIKAKEEIDLNCFITSNKVWDETTELSKLYDCELNTSNNFIEQKFLDYLAVNGEDIELIHWRNFEKFCATFFKKEGYDVILGPGTNDGGVDIRAYSDIKKVPDIIIQCKRYKKENKISIEVVKSFYADVLFEGAKEGIIATTSYIAKGGKKITETRGYNLRFAEREKIKSWARKMWQHNK